MSVLCCQLTVVLSAAVLLSCDIAGRPLSTKFVSFYVEVKSVAFKCVCTLQSGMVIKGAVRWKSAGNDDDNFRELVSTTVILATGTGGGRL